MSVASFTGQIYYKRKIGVYMPAITSNKGDLYQQYEGDSTNPIRVVPDYSSFLPVLSFVVASSLAGNKKVEVSSVTWFFNGEEIKFSNSYSNNEWDGERGHFKELPAGGSRSYHGIQICKNLVKASGAAPCVIRCVGDIIIGNNTEQVQSSYNIPITYGVDNSKRVTIAAADNYDFAIPAKGMSIRMKAVTSVGTDEITTGLTYKWYKLVNGAWSNLNQVGQFITVSDKDIDSAGQFKVEVFLNGNLIGTDSQIVLDTSDPVLIRPCPDPENETLPNERDEIVYTPKVVTREGNPFNNPRTGRPFLFYFTFTDAAGNPLADRGGNSTTVRDKAIVYTGMCEQAGGNLTYNITTED